MRAPLVTAAPALQIGQANLAVARFTPPAAAPHPSQPPVQLVPTRENPGHHTGRFRNWLRLGLQARERE